MKREFDETLAFNKDLACLQEIQRLENVYANSVCLGRWDVALNCLVLITGKLLAKMSIQDQNNAQELKKNCIGIIKNNLNKPQNIYHEQKIDEYYQFLNTIMVKTSIHLNKIQSSAGATDV